MHFEHPHQTRQGTYQRYPVSRHMYCQNAKPTKDHPIGIVCHCTIQWEQINHGMNDLYVVPSPAHQGTYLVVDTILQYCIKN